jgi:uncharacterized protein (DUF362 family)
MASLAFIERLSTADYEELIRRGLEYIRFGNLVTPATKIFLKPNLTFPTYRQGVMTSPQAVEAAMLAIRGYTSRIYVGDADSGGYNRFSMDEVYGETGLGEFAKRIGVEVINLSSIDRKAIAFQYKHRDFRVSLPRLLTDEIDLLVTLPVPKVHANTGVSLTFKNQWGCIPEPTDRLRLHPYLEHVVLEVNKAVRAKVAIVDGKYGLNVNGPMRGQAVELDWVMVTDDIGAGAALTCELMQIPLEEVRHLRYIRGRGYIPDRGRIQVNQDIAPFQKTPFYLRRNWTDYPGYLAFHNSFVAYLAYFSPLANLLHRILYLFREPFYDYQR